MNETPSKRTEPKTASREHWRPVRFILIVLVMALVNWWVSRSHGQTMTPAEVRQNEAASSTIVSGVAAPPAAPQSADPSARAQWYFNYDQALGLADRERLPVLIYFSGDQTWCQWCQKLEAEVFQTDAFAAWSEGRVVLLEVRYPAAPRANDVRTIRTMRIIRQYQAWITGYPTVLVISPQEDVLGKIGYVPGGVHAWIQEAQPFVGQKDKIARVD